MKLKIALFVLILILVLTAAGVGMYYSLPYRYDNADEHICGDAEVTAKDITAVRIHWLFGYITMEQYDGDTISLKEEKAPDAEGEKMWYRTADGVLDIRFCKSGTMARGAQKQLTLMIPRQLNPDLTVFTRTANIMVRSGSFRNVTVFNDTGLTRMLSASADRITCKTDSGSVNFHGTMNSGKFETVSGNHALTYLNTPEKLEFYSVDGLMQLALPPEATFRTAFYTKDGSLTSGFKGTVEENILTVGDKPTAKMDIVTVSGDLEINKTKVRGK